MELSAWPIFSIRSSDCRIAREVPSVIKVPRPEYASTKPFSCSALIASRTAVRLTPDRTDCPSSDPRANIGRYANIGRQLYDYRPSYKLQSTNSPNLPIDKVWRGRLVIPLYQ